MRTRSKAKEPEAPVKKGARRSTIKPDAVVEVHDDFQTSDQGQAATAESLGMLEEKQDTELPVTISRSPIHDQKTIGNESHTSFTRGGGSEVSLEKVVPELKSEPNQEEANKASHVNTISEMDNSISDSIVAVILNEESTVEMKVQLPASVKDVTPVEEHDGSIEETKEDIHVSPGVRVEASFEAIETPEKEDETMQVNKLMTEGCEAQVDNFLSEQTLNETKGIGIDGDKIEREAHPGVDIEQTEHTEMELGKDTGKGMEGEIKGHGEDAANDFEENAGISEEFSDFQQSLPMFERQRRKKLEVFVGGVEKEATEDDIKEAFKVAGEITEVCLMRNSQTGKNKGYAFVRYATAEEAKRAVSELDRVKVRGKSCGVLPSDENDTIFIGNINKTWKKEAVMEKLTGYGIENIEELTLPGDPQNEGLNRGFAFLELATHKDALKAFKRLQQPNAIFDAQRSAKVAWAQPMNEPDEEAMAQVKSVFVDGMPPTWDEEKVREHFGMYGDIEKIVLARNMSSAQRKDFGFVNFATRDAALACIEALNDSEVAADGDTKVKVKLMLAKPQIKHKPFKGGVHGGFPVQMSGGKLASSSGGGQGRGGILSGLRGGRAVGHSRHGSMARGFVGGRGVLPHHQLLQPTAYMGRTQGGNARGAYSRHFELVHPSARNAWPVSAGPFQNVYAGRGGYGAVMLAGRQGETYQDQPLRQATGRNFRLGYNHGMAGAAGAVREYGAAVSGVKRAFSAMEDPRYADAAARHSRARIEPPTRLGGFQYAAGSVGGNSASSSVSHPTALVARGPPGISASYGQQHGFIGGMYPSGSHVYNAAQSADYRASVSEMRRKPSQPAAYGASAGSAGYGAPGTGEHESQAEMVTTHRDNFLRQFTVGLQAFVEKPIAASGTEDAADKGPSHKALFVIQIEPRTHNL